MRIKLNLYLKFIVPIIGAIFLFNSIYSNIAPNPIVGQGVFTLDSCKIQLISEVVNVDLYNDSSIVNCSFELYNHSDSILIQIGFPEMNFDYWGINQYNLNDKARFQIVVDNNILSTESICVPIEMDSIYNAYMEINSIENEYNRKIDSVLRINNALTESGEILYPRGSYNKIERDLDAVREWRDNKPRINSDLLLKFYDQRKKGNIPWYIWNVSFKENETKIIKVSYALPAGIEYGDEHRYFKYLLNTGAGWYGSIKEANVYIKISDLDVEDIDEKMPSGYSINTDENFISWKFNDFEPTVESDIYLRYEKKDWFWNLFDWW